MQVGQGTDRGNVRKANEDNLIVKKSLFAVADGLGGHRAGEVASALAIEMLDKIEQNNIENLQILTGKLKKAIVEANDRIHKLSMENHEFSGMGTTVTCLAIKDDKGVIAHVGDSRAYVIKENSIKKVTDDHSVTSELIKEGGLTEAEAQSHPYKNWLTRALGTEDAIDIDLHFLDILQYDYIMLCTDGLTAVVDDEEISSIINSTGLIQGKVDNLIKTANNNGGPDNITVVLLDLKEGSSLHLR